MTTWAEGIANAKTDAAYFTEQAIEDKSSGNGSNRDIALIEAVLAVAARLEVLAYKLEVRG